MFEYLPHLTRQVMSLIVILQLIVGMSLIGNVGESHPKIGDFGGLFHIVVVEAQKADVDCFLDGGAFFDGFEFFLGELGFLFVFEAFSGFGSEMTAL